MKNGKMKKKKVNTFDIVIVLVLLLIVGVLGYKYLSSSSPETSAINVNDTVEYEIEIEGVRIYTADALSVGDNVYDVKKGTYMGEIKEIEITSSKNYMLKDEELIEVQKPDRYDLIIKIKAPVTNKEKGYFLSGVLELKVNSIYGFKTKKVRSSLVVTNIYDESEGN